MTVWLLWDRITEYDGPDLLGVYASKEAAEGAMAESLAEEEFPNPGDMEVEERVVVGSSEGV